MLLSIVMPAYNEEKSLEGIVEKVLSVKFPNNVDIELVIINDGSKDNTWEIMQKLAKKHKEIKIFSNEKNLGKSQIVRRGILETKGDIVVIQDADFEYDPNEIPNLLELMQEKNLDVVYGNRFGKKNKVIYWKNYIGNKSLSAFSNVFTFPRVRVWIPDMEVCYKMVRGDIFREIGENIKSKSMFGLEPEITAKLSKYKRNGKHLKFGIVPITYNARTIEEGKKMKAFSDGFKALKEILIYNIF
jgi:glycosyltransferase involved in cell wall biosynthesis